MFALTDAQAEKLLVSSSTQVMPALSAVFSRLECELNQVQPAIRTPKARAAALATVDQDIDAAKRLILSLFTRHNMLVQISILPAEILAPIFQFVAFSKHPYSRTGTPKLGSVYSRMYAGAGVRSRWMTRRSGRTSRTFPGPRTGSPSVYPERGTRRSSSILSGRWLQTCSTCSPRTSLTHASSTSTTCLSFIQKLSNRSAPRKLR